MESVLVLGVEANRTHVMSCHVMSCMAGDLHRTYEYTFEDQRDKLKQNKVARNKKKPVFAVLPLL